MSTNDGSHDCPQRAIDDSALFSSSSPLVSSLSTSPTFSTSAPLPGLAATRSLHEANNQLKPGNSSLLKKSRSISGSNARNDSAMLRFPGPLLPTVRRLNSSPASSKPGNRDIGEGNTEPFAADTKNEPSSLATRTLISPNSYQGFRGSVEANSSAHNTNSIDTKSRQGYREDIEPKTPSKAPRLKIDTEVTTLWSTSLKPDSHPSNSNASLAGGWRYRSRSETNGNDSSFMPPAKAQRITAEYNSRLDRVKLDDTSTSILQCTRSGQDLLVHTASEGPLVIGQSSRQHVHGFSSDSVSMKPAQPRSWVPKLPDDKVSLNIDDNGSASSSRRRRVPESLSLRQSTDAWLSEIRPPMRACASCTEGSGLALKPMPSKLAPFIRWPVGHNKLAFKNVTLPLLLIIFTSSMCYSAIQHHQLRHLRRENARLKAGSCQSLGTGSYYLDTKLMDGDEEVSIDKALWKLSFVGGLVLVLCGSYLSKNRLIISYLTRKPYSKSTEEDVPLSKHVAYLVDVLFSTHPYAKAIALLFATLLLIGFGGCSLYAVGDQNLSDALWRSWTYVADSGNHADSVGLGPRIVSVSISIGGMLIFALMLGLVSDAISEKVDSLRKGKSEVIESGHTLILGWSDKLGSLLKQLAIANQSLGGGVVVVLAERDKEEMELDIAKLEFDLMGTSVICRSGSPLIMADLKKVSVSKARSIVVLAEVENADQSDARALRVVLSLTAVKEGLQGHIVVELSDLDNEPLVKLVGGDVVETVVAHDVIGRLMIQCARQPGLAQIWEDILGFDKAEFYLKRWPQLDGMQFRDVLVSFPEAIPCGVKVAGDKGRIILNPNDDYVLCEGDEVLVIAEDDDTYAPASLPKLLCGSLPRVIVPPKLPERILFCGWRRDIHDMIKVLDAFLPSGSELWIFSDVCLEEREKKLHDENLDLMVNIKLEHRQGNPVIRRHLESLPLQTFDSILILADEKLEENVVIADSRSLATLLLIRDIQSKRLPINSSKVTQLRRPGFIHGSWIGDMQQASDKSIIISEILDSRTKHLVSVSQIGDYVLSNELVSMALAMVAEEKQINRVLEELFAEEGNELCIRSAEFYLYDQEELSFFEIMIRARQRKETVVGYRRSSQERAIINPPNKAVSQKWSIEDVFIVLG